MELTPLHAHHDLEMQREPHGHSLEPRGQSLEPRGQSLEPHGHSLEPRGHSLEPSSSRSIPAQTERNQVSADFLDAFRSTHRAPSLEHVGKVLSGQPVELPPASSPRPVASPRQPMPSPRVPTDAAHTEYIDIEYGSFMPSRGSSVDSGERRANESLGARGEAAAEARMQEELAAAQPPATTACTTADGQGRVDASSPSTKVPGALVVTTTAPFAARPAMRSCRTQTVVHAGVDRGTQTNAISKRRSRRVARAPTAARAMRLISKASQRARQPREGGAARSIFLERAETLSGALA